MTAPIGCAKRAVGTMLAIRKPIDRMLEVLISRAIGKAEPRNMDVHRIVALARQHHQSASVTAVSSSFTSTCAVRMVCGRSGVARSRLRMPPSR